jgi:hypothetical protein
MTRISVFFRRFPRLLAAVALVVLATLAIGPRQKSCACAIPPIPNLYEFSRGVLLLERGDYRTALLVFDDVVRDNNSAQIRAEALYGRGLSKSALGNGEGGDADRTAARQLVSSIEARFAILKRAFGKRTVN